MHGRTGTPHPPLGRGVACLNTTVQDRASVSTPRGKCTPPGASVCTTGGVSSQLCFGLTGLPFPAELTAPRTSAGGQEWWEAQSDSPLFQVEALLGSWHQMGVDAEAQGGPTEASTSPCAHRVPEKQVEHFKAVWGMGSCSSDSSSALSRQTRRPWFQNPPSTCQRCSHKSRCGCLDFSISPPGKLRQVQ